MMLRTQGRSIISIAMLLVLVGCAQTPEKFEVKPDRFRTAPEAFLVDDDPETERREGSHRIQRLSPIDRDSAELRGSEELALRFSSNDQVQFSANNLSLREFVQQIFGETLGVNYIISDPASEVDPITLNISEPVSSRRLFALSDQLLLDRGLQVSVRDNIFYIYPDSEEQSQTAVIGLGRTYNSVPDTSRQILQVIPIRFGITESLDRTLRALSTADVSYDSAQSAIFATGSRTQILRVLDLVTLLDIPSARSRYIGLQELTYITPEEYMGQLIDLLDAEGIVAVTTSRSSGGPAASGAALLMIPIEQIGAVALFAGDEFILDRVEYWASQIDRPTRGAERRYYIYNPRYARAKDLGESIAPLIGGVVQQSGEGDQGRSTQSAQSSNVGAGGNEEIRMTIDDRSNSILFFTQGEMYQALLPIIRRLDVMPKQVMLDATIAEVTLTDEFSQGFEFAFRSGRLTGGTRNALGVSEMGGFRLDWTDGISTMLARLSASSNLVNVLSNPTLVVRDGVAATINVGNDIPTVGSTTTNPNFESQTTNIVYRRTGVNLTVTPTVNAQGLVVMQIDQQISNTSTSGPSLQGSPSIFERNVQTEVIARSGQTILLGGLISESRSENASEVPGVSRIPLLGRLFKGESQQTEKTELVIFITPRVIDDLNDWDHIRNTINQGLTTIKISDWQELDGRKNQ